jgi:hypothetical protein
MPQAAKNISAPRNMARQANIILFRNDGNAANLTVPLRGAPLGGALGGSNDHCFSPSIRLSVRP